jgi:hypothetical protein
METATLRASYRQRGQNWEGVVKDGKRIVAECGHSHHNRDQSTGWSGTCAMDCARKLLRSLTADAAPLQ